MSSPSRDWAIASLIGGIFFAGVAVVPLPFSRWVALRQSASFAAFGCFLGGYFSTKKAIAFQEILDEAIESDKEQQRLIREATQPIVVAEVVENEQQLSQLRKEDFRLDAGEAFATVQLDKRPEWVRQQIEADSPQNVAETEVDKPSKAQMEVETAPEVKVETEAEAIERSKSCLLELIANHEGGWISQLMKKPVYIYGDQGAYKSYFAAFLALCRHYLRGHQVVSIADPHFHQNKSRCWKELVSLGVPGYGGNYNYHEVGQQIYAMFDRFAERTEDDAPLTSIFDELTMYKDEEGTREPGKLLIPKAISCPRKANESPIFLAHDDTNSASGGSDGFAKARNRNMIKIELFADSEQEPLFRGNISGIKDENGNYIEKEISIAAKWIRPAYVWALFEKTTQEAAESKNSKVKTADIQPESDVEKLDRLMSISDDYWLAESDPDKLEQLIELRKKKTGKFGNSGSNSRCASSLAETSSQSRELVDPFLDGEFPRSWNAADFSRLLPNEREDEMFEKLIAYLDTSRNASEIIKHGLGFSKEKYSKLGKPCFKYLVRTHGSIALIKQFADYLEKE
ncbi:hypothetical protein [Microcoleus sp. CAWBG58]|uniref:hypothetical protein n=1 Tax=Microcoleus sp. CAWBG58 TaxID=2841651 RepID=UPI0025F8E1A0|nr:hypothetical protein [Microcoleus sp. CAWBG58]